MTAKENSKHYLVAYLEGFYGIETCLNIVQGCVAEATDAAAIKEILMNSLEYSEDAQRATICFLAQLLKDNRISAKELSNAFEQLLGEMGPEVLEDLQIDIPKVDIYLYSMLSQGERQGLIPCGTSASWIPLRHQALSKEIAASNVDAAVSLLMTLLDGRAPDVVEDSADLQRFSIFNGIPCAARDVFLEKVLCDSLVDRAVGAMVGMAVGDSVGQPLEFVPACQSGHSFDPKTLLYTGIHNSVNLKPGQWTDDAAMGLCIADSLLLKKSYNGSDIRIRFWN